MVVRIRLTQKLSYRAPAATVTSRKDNRMKANSEQASGGAISSSALVRPLSREAKTILWALRCEYVAANFRLSRKGRGWLTPSMWRVVHRIVCRFSKRHKQEMHDYLKHTLRQHQHRTLKAEGRMAEMA